MNIPRNIYIVGAHCTGKTTLLEALKDHLSGSVVAEIFGGDTDRPIFIDEVAREVMAKDRFRVGDIKKKTEGFELQKCVLLSQYQAEKALEDRWFVSDRSGIDPIIYTEFFLGCPAAERLVELPEWSVLRDGMRKGLVIVCLTHNDSWVSSDRVRVKCKDQSEWKALGDAFLNGLQQHGIAFTAIPQGMDDIGERVHFVENILRSTYRT
ncbi:hypothetical protein ETB97_004282 [Aspergillus alliaceus]|uniref:NadR/Ttd14 AAA domain-containing protein n=1 Tax=Petromyces alliaceus TaxID=209559 RepID=A0A8H6E3Z5_PETAA|nr:hypothetical protein ETB97_004282 [Aspergillus burnettii]